MAITNKRKAGRPRKEEKVMAKEKVVETAKPPLTVADTKVNTVAEAKVLISQGLKIRHPGPWVKITPMEGKSLEETLIALREKLVGYDPKTQEGIFKEGV